jgi:hypothetical protein
MMGVIIGIIVLLVAIATWHGHAKAQRRLIEWGVSRAVEIATYQGWVSHYRLTTQALLTTGDAQLVLRKACERGLLYHSVNGRYYIANLAARRIIKHQ